MKNNFTYSFADFLPQIDDDVNKYTRGRVVILAGSSQYPGAAILCSKAAARSGCGYVEIFTNSDVIKQIQLANPSIVVRDLQNFSKFADKKKVSSYLIGPGTIFCSEQKQALISILEKDDGCVVIDAEMINALNSSDVRQVAKGRKNAIIITPHAGELQKWTEIANRDLKTKNLSDIERIVKDKIAKEELNNLIVVAKGTKTVIISKNNTLHPTCGTYSLATAGSGDVLAGIIAGLLAQGKPTKIEEAAQICALSVEIHALSGILCAEKFGKRSVMAQDISDFIGKAIDRIQKTYHF